MPDPSVDLYRYAVESTPGPNGTTARAEGDGLVEVAQLDGYAYVAASGAPAEQPAGVVLEPVTLTPELRAALREASPLCRLIDAMVVQSIRERYSVDDELYFARISVGTLMGAYTPEPGELAALPQYQSHVEAAREWGRRERGKLGL